MCPPRLRAHTQVRPYRSLSYTGAGFVIRFQAAETTGDISARQR